MRLCVPAVAPITMATQVVMMAFLASVLISIVAAQSGFQAWKDTALTPKQRAAAILSEMTVDEKISMLHGVSADPYSGLVSANTRLGIPAIKMNDGPQVRQQFVNRDKHVLAQVVKSSH